MFWKINVKLPQTNRYTRNREMWTFDSKEILAKMM